MNKNNNNIFRINSSIFATLTQCNDLGIRNIHIMIESDTRCDEIHRVKKIEQVIGAIMRYGIYCFEQWKYIQNITILYDDSQLSRAANINAINMYLDLLSPQNQEAITSVS